MRDGWPWVVALSILVLSCRAKNEGPADAAPPPKLGASAAKRSERANDELWRRAASADPLDLARLADREGVAGLLEGLEEGGPTSLAALDALPLTDDAEAAYGRLGEIAARIEPGEMAPIVTAIAGIALRPRRQTEPVDPAGMRSCANALLDLARKRGLSRPLRAKVISALRLLSERGALDGGAIPDDLDAR
jgi:hypothetical protein